MSRAFWILLGACAQLVFFFTVYQLFAFLYAGGGDLLAIEPLPGTVAWGDGLGDTPPTSALAIDLLLLAQFGLSHSLFLYPAVRRQLDRLFPEGLYGSFYTLVACASLLTTFACWQPLPGLAFQAEGPLAWMLLLLFLASWAALIYSLSLTGLGFQTGFTTWWAFVCRQPIPRRPFVTHGAYRFLRHPIYLSFLGLIWFTPRLTTDHLLMASIWSLYIFVGSVLKDRRLLYFMGERYRTYMAQVSGYPLLPWGPLARASGPVVPVKMRPLSQSR